MSVYKDKKRGTYYVSFSQKDILTGKFKHVTKRGFLTSKEAKQWERENYGKVRIRNVSKSFSDISKEWEQACQASLEVQQKHKAHFEKRFAEFQNRAIESITKADLITWRNELAEMPYSTRTKNTTIAYVKGVFRFATDMYGVPNQASMLRSLKPTNNEVMQEMEVWTPEEFQRFLAVVDAPVLKLYFEFLFWTGCRRGEALAIQKNDVSDKCATIRYSQRARKNGLKPTKTKQVRRIELDDQLWNDLQPLLIQNGKYLFGGDEGLTPNYVSNHFNKAVCDSGVKQIRIHDLRHSHATWLINNGVNIVAVSKRLGHATIEQTLKTYTHLLSTTDQEMMFKINDYRSPSESKRETNEIKNPKISRGEKLEKVPIILDRETKSMRQQYTDTDSPHLL